LPIVKTAGKLDTQNTTAKIVNLNSKGFSV